MCHHFQDIPALALAPPFLKSWELQCLECRRSWELPVGQGQGCAAPTGMSPSVTAPRPRVPGIWWAFVARVHLPSGARHHVAPAWRWELSLSLSLL